MTCSYWRDLALPLRVGFGLDPVEWPVKHLDAQAFSVAVGLMPPGQLGVATLLLGRHVSVRLHFRSGSVLSNGDQTFIVERDDSRALMTLVHEIVTMRSLKRLREAATPPLVC
jgi:hypothetical protein